MKLLIAAGIYTLVVVFAVAMLYAAGTDDHDPNRTTPRGAR